jgi:hypothetical protein
MSPVFYDKEQRSGCSFWMRNYLDMSRYKASRQEWMPAGIREFLFSEIVTGAWIQFTVKFIGCYMPNLPYRPLLTCTNACPCQSRRAEVAEATDRETSFVTQRMPAQ